RQQELLADRKKVRDVRGLDVRVQLDLETLRRKVHQSNASRLGLAIRIPDNELVNLIDDRVQLHCARAVSQPQGGLHQDLVSRCEILDVCLGKRAGRDGDQGLFQRPKTYGAQRDVFDPAKAIRN